LFESRSGISVPQAGARMNSAEEDLLRRVKEQAEVLVRRQEETRTLILALRSVSKGWATSGIERAAALGAGADMASSPLSPLLPSPQIDGSHSPLPAPPKVFANPAGGARKKLVPGEKVGAILDNFQGAAQRPRSQRDADG
jgi:hypothetical protein